MDANWLVTLLIVVGAAGLVAGVSIGRFVAPRRGSETVPLAEVTAALAVIRAEIAALPELLAWKPQRTHLAPVRVDAAERAA